jgi:hypothetical protein
MGDETQKTADVLEKEEEFTPVSTKVEKNDQGELIVRLDRDAQIILTSEAVNHKNIKASIDHCNDTRRRQVQLEQRMEEVGKMMVGMAEHISALQNQMANLRAQMFQQNAAGGMGSTSGQ